MTSIGRRRFLASLGAGGAILAGGAPRAARAGGPVVPKRLLVVATGHGSYTPGYRMADPLGAPASAGYEIDLPSASAGSLSPILSPLAPYRDRLLALDGLCMTSAMNDEPLNEHTKGQIHALTASPFVATAGGRGADASAPSLDRLIGARNQQPGTFANLDLGIRSQLVVFDDAGRTIQPRTDPSEVFASLFGSLVPSPVEDTRASRLSRGRRATFAFLDAEYERVAAGAPTEVRERLGVHRDLVAGLASRLVGIEGLSCEPPLAPSDRGDAVNSRADWDRRIQTWADTIAAAMACDLTRTVVLQLGAMPTEVFGAPPDGDMHEAYAHPVWTSADAQHWMTEYNRTHAQHIKTLLDALEAVPVSATETLLDHTLVYWMNELADGSHSFRGYNATLIGGQAFTGWRMGRFVRLAPDGLRPRRQRDSMYDRTRTDTFAPWNRLDPGLGPPHGRLLTSIAEAFDPSIGPVGVTTIDGAECEDHPSRFGTIDAASPLPILR